MYASYPHCKHDGKHPERLKVQQAEGNNDAISAVIEESDDDSGTGMGSGNNDGPQDRTGGGDDNYCSHCGRRDQPAPVVVPDNHITIAKDAPGGRAVRPSLGARTASGRSMMLSFRSRRRSSAVAPIVERDNDASLGGIADQGNQPGFKSGNSHAFSGVASGLGGIDNPGSSGGRIDPNGPHKHLYDGTPLTASSEDLGDGNSRGIHRPVAGTSDPSEDPLSRTAKGDSTTGKIMEAMGTMFHVGSLKEKGIERREEAKTIKPLGSMSLNFV